MEIELVNVMAYKLPKEALDCLRPLALAANHKDVISDSALLVWTVIEAWEREQARQHNT